MQKIIKNYLKNILLTLAIIFILFGANIYTENFNGVILMALGTFIIFQVNKEY